MSEELIIDELKEECKKRGLRFKLSNGNKFGEQHILITKKKAASLEIRNTQVTPNNNPKFYKLKKWNSQTSGYNYYDMGKIGSRCRSGIRYFNSDEIYKILDRVCSFDTKSDIKLEECIKQFQKDKYLIYASGRVKFNSKLVSAKVKSVVKINKNNMIKKIEVGKNDDCWFLFECNRTETNLNSYLLYDSEKYVPLNPTSSGFRIINTDILLTDTDRKLLDLALKEFLKDKDENV